MKPIIVMQTDFGIGGGSAMRGTIRKVDDEIPVYEASHIIEKFNVRAAGILLRHMVPYWPAGTIFVSVVDPGVGTARRASVALLNNGSYIVTPDNGTLTPVLETVGVKAIRKIDETRNRLKGTEKVSIFHGRDLFAYCAARLASGIIDFEGVGEEYPVEEIVRYKEPEFGYSDGRMFGHITGMMRTFGNLESNIPLDFVEKAGLEGADPVHVKISRGDQVFMEGPVAFKASFGWVDEGAEVVYKSSSGYIGIGVNRGSFADRYKIDSSGEFEIEITKEEG